MSRVIAATALPMLHWPRGIAARPRLLPVWVFSLPDCTVGTGIAPVQRLKNRRSRTFTAGGELLHEAHPAPKTIRSMTGRKVLVNTATGLVYDKRPAVVYLYLKLKDRRKLLKGRREKCHFLDACNGNSCERAEAVYDDLWAEDPACYLSDEER